MTLTGRRCLACSTLRTKPPPPPTSRASFFVSEPVISRLTAASDKLLLTPTASQAGVAEQRLSERPDRLLDLVTDPGEDILPATRASLLPHGEKPSPGRQADSLHYVVVALRS